MKVKVLREFYDKNDLRHKYSVGEIVEFETERAKDIIERGLGEEVKAHGEQDGEEVEHNKKGVDVPVDSPAVDDKPFDETPAAESAEEPAAVEELAEEPANTDETPAAESAEEPVRRRGRRPGNHE